MIRLLLFLTFLAGISLVAVWAADHPGQVVIHWSGWRIETSLAVMIVLALIAAWLMASLYALFRHIVSIPQRFSERQRLKHYQQGMAELTYGVAALATSDDAAASRHVHKAEKLLGVTPLGILLSAQIAKSRGDGEQMRGLLMQLLEYKETKHMAARLLAPPPSEKTKTAVSWRKTLGHWWQRFLQFGG